MPYAVVDRGSRFRIRSGRGAAVLNGLTKVSARLVSLASFVRHVLDDDSRVFGSALFDVDALAFAAKKGAPRLVAAIPDIDDTQLFHHSLAAE